MVMDKVDIKKLIEERGLTGKFDGVAPEGFVLIHEDTLEELKDFNTWKEWKHNQLSILELNNKHFDNI
jgi:hypothetical protein